MTAVEEVGDPRLARLRWRCRRGMLELDVVLQRFLAAHVASLSDTELDAFERLLQTPDPELLGYVQGTCEPADSGLRQLVAKIR
jgi:antitoxin CptB